MLKAGLTTSVPESVPAGSLLELDEERFKDAMLDLATGRETLDLSDKEIKRGNELAKGDSAFQQTMDKIIARQKMMRQQLTL